MTTTNRVRNGIGDDVVNGTSTNDNAAPGMVGEYITSTVAPGAAIPLTSGAGVNVTSITLTPGDWDVTCQVNFLTTLATLSDMRIGASTVSTALPAQGGGSGLSSDGLAIFALTLSAVSNTFTINSLTVRVSIAVPTTIYMVSQATFTIGSITAYGTIRARRTR